MAPPVDPPPVPLPAQLPATAHTFAERLDDRISVAGDDGHHLQRARRVKAGESVTVADGYGRWRAYEVERSAAGVVELVAVTLVAHEPVLSPRLTVACSLTKGQKPELAVQKLTELGVDRIMLVEAARSVVHWDDAKSGAAFARLERVAREAAMQSRRARVPVVEGPVAPVELATLPGLVVAAIDGVPAAALAPVPAEEWIVAVGPEGGFDDAELRGFGTAPRLAVGPFVLRAETAAIAAAAALVGHRRLLPARDRREW
jgi:16S rRNA (uracil1498-N3)-methyltransferase